MFEYPLGATPLDGDEIEALIPKHIRTQADLNAFEHMNISQALPWALRQKNITQVRILQRLHQVMFNHTWKWAGQYRKTQKNIGIEAYRIEPELQALCHDIAYHIQHKVFEPDEIALRFHHRLVWIHPFPNGNGRHARLAADLLVQKLGCKPFSWGSSTFTSQNLEGENNMRKAYIEALRQADHFVYEPLFTFARS
jgi:Fic-DOC domain mobile mystery protein B